MLILEVLLELTAKQDNTASGFLHADLEVGKHIFVEMSKIFERTTKC